ncbi:MAG: FAD:protein FMN transferase [Puniceicoccales bacterium]|nr:FAD:protein FMN transferase [Puniceicoccales bacterium]
MSESETGHAPEPAEDAEDAEDAQDAVDEAARGTRRFDHAAMNTVFTIFFDAELVDAGTAAGAAQEAFRLLGDIEARLSAFVPTSDIRRINALAEGEVCGIGAEALECLAAAAELAAATGRAFDPSAGALIDFWKERQAAPAALTVGAETAGDTAAESVTGGAALDKADASADPAWSAAWEAHRKGEFALDPDSRLVKCVTRGSRLDLGGVGKGYALDKMGALLRDDWGVGGALLSAGGSTVLALGSPAGKPGWKIGFGGETRLPCLLLGGGALGSSGLEFQSAHIVDPRTGLPVTRRGLVRSIAPSATEADALSTAFFVMGREEAAAHCAKDPTAGHIALFEKRAAGDDVPEDFDILGEAGALTWARRTTAAA